MGYFLGANLMKKRFLFIIIAIAVAVYGYRTWHFIMEIRSDYYVAKEQKCNEEFAEEILRCFDEKDSEQLKKLFNKNLMGNSSLNSQIKEAFAIYEGKSSGYEKLDNKGVFSSNADNGIYIERSVGESIEGIKVGDNKFTIMFIRCSLDAKDSNNVGLVRVYLEDDKHMNLSIIGDISTWEVQQLKKNLDERNGITEEYIDETASIIVTNGQTDKDKVLQNGNENIIYVENLLQSMNMTPYEGNEEGYSQYDYKFPVLNRKNQLKSMYTMTNNHCCITDKDYKDTYYTIDDTSTYNELIEFAKSLVD